MLVLVIFSFEFKYGYHFCVFYKENFNLYSKLKTARKLSFKLQDQIITCQQNCHHAQKLQKQAYNKGVKP